MSKPQYKYIYSNPRLKNKNDHDNPSQENKIVVLEKYKRKKGIWGNLQWRKE